jgi:transcription initiation factor IIE alpha subunit
MNKKEYQNKRAELLKVIALSTVDLSALNVKFKKECSHPIKELREKTNSYEDEYGKDMDSWTDYDFKCDRCGTELKRVKKDNIPKSVKDLRQRLREQNEI